MSAYYALHVTLCNFVFSFNSKIFAKINKSRSINIIMQITTTDTNLSSAPLFWLTLTNILKYL